MKGLDNSFTQTVCVSAATTNEVYTKCSAEMRENMTKTVYRLEPLTCPSCVKKIETTLNKIAGVESAKVMFHSNKVKVEYDENNIDAEKIKKTMIKLGYSVLE